MGRSTVTLDDLTSNNLGTFKTINESSLPTLYSESWYKDSLNVAQVSQLAFFSELPVGAIKGKLINLEHNIPTFEVSSATRVNSKLVPNAMYLESLAVLPAYRGHGVGSMLLEWLIKRATELFVHQIALHLHVSNTEALAWYMRKGFVQQNDIAKNYYKQQGIENPDAYILTLAV